MLCETNGTAEAARRLVIGLGKAGHDVHVFSPTNGVSGRKGINYHKVWGFQVNRHPEFHFPIPWWDYYRVNHDPRIDGLDLVHAITPLTMGAMALNTAKFKNLPKIITHHSPLKFYALYFPYFGIPFSFFAWDYEKFFYDRFNVVHVPTLTKKQLITGFRFKEPIFALTNGINEAYFRQVKNARSEICEKYKIPEDKKIILYAGRQGYEKNIESIIRAAKNVRKAGVDAHLLLAGGGPHIPVLKKYAEKQGLGDHLTQTGLIHHDLLRAIYKAADVSTIYNDIEAQGLVLLEAMAQGTPCVGKNATGIADVIVDGKTGYLVNDEQEFCQRLVKILQDDDLREKMGKQALAVVTKFHKMDSVVEVWTRTYNFLIDVIHPMHVYGVPEPEIVLEWREFVAKEPLMKM